MAEHSTALGVVVRSIALLKVVGWLLRQSGYWPKPTLGIWRSRGGNAPGNWLRATCRRLS